MDNDNKVIKVIKNTIKSVKFKYDYRDKKILKDIYGNNLIYDMLMDDKTPCMISRFGAVEARCVNKWIKKIDYSEYNIKSINEAAGFFPNTPKEIDRFCYIYMESASISDVISVWGVIGERQFIDKYCEKATLIGIKALEPYLFENPWSLALEGKKILVIHPFVDSIRKQYEKRKVLFKDKNILPDFKSLSCVKAIQSNAGEKTDFKDWFEALDYMCKEIEMVDFDIAIIGAGAYGLPLASFIKRLGKKAIHMAGATQLLFGIRGKRWDERSEYANLINENWVRPSKDETPEKKDKVEGGSYW